MCLVAFLPRRAQDLGPCTNIDQLTASNYTRSQPKISEITDNTERETSVEASYEAMTVVSMSLFPSGHSQAPSLTIRPPHSILSATLTAKSSQSLLTASQAKAKLGFSIDSIVGDRERSPRREEPQSPASRSPRDRSQGPLPALQRPLPLPSRGQRPLP